MAPLGEHSPNEAWIADLTSGDAVREWETRRGTLRPEPARLTGALVAPRLRRMPSLVRLPALAALSAICAFAPPAARAAASDPAARTIEAFDDALLATLKAGPALGVQGRYRKLAPVVEQTFDLPLMSRYAVGPTWPAISPADQQALVRAFTRLTIASYAHNFDRYGGERFEVDPNVVARGPDHIVQSRLATPSRTVMLTYRMRQGAGGWRIVDVYFDGVSQLATRRADFQGTLASGGAKALLTHLAAVTDNLLR